MREIKNAKITNTFLGIEDHGIFTFILNFDYGSMNQGSPSYSLDKSDSDGNIIGYGAGIKAIRKILETLDLYQWENLKDSLVRVKINEHNLISAIGHIIKDQWFEFDLLSIWLRKEEQELK